MASKWPPVKNQEFIFRCVLFAQSDNQIKANPTTAAGDWKVSTDGGAFANLATLPDVDPDTTAQVKVTLSASEMNGDEIMVTAIDASGDEWHSAAWVIHTVGQTLDTMDANIDSILADTGTDGVVLANDAITAAKFDETTAFPLKSADTGATAVARTGADSDTLETLSDEIAAIPTTTLSAADVRTAVGLASANLDTQLADLPTNGELATALAGADDAVLAAIPSAASVADAVWDEDLTDHLTADSTGAGLNAAGSAGDPWSTALPGAYGAGSAGKILGDNLNAPVGDVPTNSELTSALSGLSTLDAAGIRTAIGLAAANLDTQLGALSTFDPESDDVTAAARTVEGALDEIEALRLILAALVGNTTGNEASAPKFRDQADTKDRIEATIDINGNRTVTAVDAS